MDVLGHSTLTDVVEYGLRACCKADPATFANAPGKAKIDFWFFFSSSRAARPALLHGIPPARRRRRGKRLLGFLLFDCGSGYYTWLLTRFKQTRVNSAPITELGF